MADRRYTINAFTVKLEGPPTSDETGRLDGITTELVHRQVRELLEFFEEHDVRATFFTANAVTIATPRSIEAIARAGHELAILSPRFITPLEQLLHFREQIATTKARLEQACGQEVLGFRSVPISSAWRSPAMLETLVQEGLLYSSSTYPKQSPVPLLLNKSIKAHRLSTPSGELWELPLTSWRPFGLGFPSIRAAGGTLLSLLPTWVIARGVEGMNRHGEPAILYVHSWALDPVAQEHSSMPLRERILHYGRRDDTLSTLRMIFSIYRFGSVIEAFASRLTTEITRARHPRRTSIIRSDKE